MGDVVNLNQFRKKQTRKAEEQQAAENRVIFGRRKDQREAAQKAAQRTEQELDGKHLD